MDRKYIQQFGTDILCYRLRIARQKKRMQYEDFDKKLIQLHIEQVALYERKRNLGWEPLVPPVQKGWRRCFVLREEVARSKNAEFFEGILKKLNTYQYSHRKDFLLKRRKRGRKVYVPKPQKLLEPDGRHFGRLGFNDMEKQFFRPEYQYFKGGRTWELRYVFTEPSRFILRVSPNVIDKVRTKDFELEARINWIWDYLRESGYRNRMAKLVYGRVYSSRGEEEDPRERNPLKNKPVQRILDELKLEQ